MKNKYLKEMESHQRDPSITIVEDDIIEVPSNFLQVYTIVRVETQEFKKTCITYFNERA